LEQSSAKQWNRWPGKRRHKGARNVEVTRKSSIGTLNNDGQVEGVKYDRVGVVLINAVKEQQAQIEAQQKQIEQQRAEIKALKALVCRTNRRAAICK
jgi:type III secretory pathway lipoprotein EscJ